MDEYSENKKLREYHTTLLEQHPELQHAQIEFIRHRHDPAFAICSPTGDRDRDIIVFISDGRISLAFGPWHTHEFNDQAISVDDTEILDSYDFMSYDVYYSIPDYIKMIVAGQIVYTIERDAILELKWKYALLEALTDPWYPDTINTVSWDGTHDRKISLKDLDCPE